MKIGLLINTYNYPASQRAIVPIFKNGISCLIKKERWLAQYTMWFLIFLAFSTAWAQSLSPENQSVAIHFHPQGNVIGISDGYVFETYDPHFEFISQFAPIAAPHSSLYGYDFKWSPDGSKLAVALAGHQIAPLASV